MRCELEVDGKKMAILIEKNDGITYYNHPHGYAGCSDAIFIPLERMKEIVEAYQRFTKNCVTM